MSNVDIKYLITALVDGEIEDERTRNTVLAAIDSNPGHRFDYMVQKKMKELVSNSIFHPAPEKLKQKIIRKLNPAKTAAGSFGYNISSPYFWVYSTAAVILIALTLIIFNRGPLDITTQSIAKNMFNEATSNFRKIVNGELKPQLVTSDPAELKSFFSSGGVKYSTVIPLFADLKLIGGVISDENGEKMAHHVYSTSAGKLLYVFQTDKQYIESGEVISLPGDIKSILEENNCYSTSNEELNSVVTIIDNNVFAVVSDLSLKEVEDHFCATFY